MRVKEPLLVIVPDAMSDIVAKGEYQPRYYNPGSLFEEVHILMCNDDKVDPKDVQGTVGDARLFIHNLPEDSRHFLQHSRRFFHPFLLKAWAKPLLKALARHQLKLLERWSESAVELARRIKPALVRCHGNDYNSCVARRIKEELGIPYAVSLHINPDVNRRRRPIGHGLTWEERLFAELFEEVEKYGLLGADIALPVYSPIVPYLERTGCKRYEIAYNVLSDRLLKKEDYRLHNPVRLLSVGRHFELKNPENMILAVKDIPGVKLTLVGDGPYQGRLEGLVANLGLGDAVEFHPAVRNDELCRALPEFDAFVIHSEHWELSKSVIEALLTGLPVIMNRRKGAGGDAAELKQGFVTFVEDSPEGYGEAIRGIVSDDSRRESLGRAAYSYAQEHWAPAKAEARYVEIYKRLIERRASGVGL